MLLKIDTEIKVSGKETYDRTRRFIHEFLGENNKLHGKENKGYSISPINQHGEVSVNINENNTEIYKLFIDKGVKVVSKPNIKNTTMISAKHVNYRKNHISENIFSFVEYMKYKFNLEVEIENYTDTKIHFKGNVLKVSNILLKVTGEENDISKLLYKGIGTGTGHGFGFCEII